MNDENVLPMTPGEDPARRKKCRRTFAVISLTLCVSYVIAFLASWLLGNYLSELYYSGKLPLPAAQVNALISFAPMYLLCFPLIFLVLSRLKKSPPEKNEGIRIKELLVLYSMCFPIMFVGSILGNVLSSLLSQGQSENRIAALLSAVDPFVIIITTILAPIFEELIFRKWIIDRTAEYGEAAAIFFSALAFGLFHMNLYQFFYTFGIGLLLAYIYLRSGRVIYTIILHVGVNFLSSVVVPFLLRQANYTEFMENLNAMDLEKALAPDTFAWVILYMIYSSLYFAAVCFGFAMLVNKRKTFTVRARENQLAAKEGILWSVLNAGTIIYILTSIYFFARALFA